MRNDRLGLGSHTLPMTRSRSTPPSDLAHRWYLAEWARHFGKTQADAQRELGWNKATASFLWTGKQRYNQDIVDQVSTWFGVEPYELLMSPKDAIALRNIRISARQIAAESASDLSARPASKLKSIT